MHALTQRDTELQLSALPFLFRRYIAGQIQQTSWEQFMHLFDAEAITTDERVALAAFFCDALAEMEPDDVHWPAINEVDELFLASAA